MNCNIIERNILDFIEGKVSAEKRSVIEKHISECDKCELLVEEVSSVWKVMTSQIKSEPSPYLWAKLQRKISEYEKPVEKLSIFENPLRYLKPVGYGLLLCLGVFLGNRIGDSYTNKEMIANLERFEIDPYLEVFSGLPEGSIGETYINLHRDF